MLRHYSFPGSLQQLFSFIKKCLCAHFKGQSQTPSNSGLDGENQNLANQAAITS
jgi:hypothetical protein